MTTNNGQTIAGTAAGSLTAMVKYVIESGFGDLFSIIYPAAIGAIVGFMITELLKYIKKKLTKK